jgi:hypothetical protein
MVSFNTALKEPGKLKKTDWALIGISWFIVQLILLKIQGINDQGESVKYIRIAENWIKGDRDLNLYNIFYFGYSSMHILLKYAGLPPKSMYAVQLILSGLSTIYFTRTLSCITHSRMAVLFSALLYTTCYTIQSWVSILYTDSIFSNLLVITTYFLITEEKSSRNKWVYWILLGMLPFFRPVGFLFIPVVCFHWIMLAPGKNMNKLFVCTAYLSVISLVVYLVFTKSGYYFPLHNIEANVICGYPGDLLKYQAVPYREGMSAFSYLYHNPGMITRLFFSRLYKVFSMGRPYFSPGHNLFLFVSSFVYYALALVGVAVIFKQHSKKIYFIIAGILIFSLPMIIFCIEWAGRFSLPVISYTLLLSGVGIDRILNMLKSKY